jgi:hypothetical protein
VEYAEEILRLPAAQRIPRTTVVVLMTADVQHNETARALADGEALLLDGPHRWWEDCTARARVSAIAAELFGGQLPQR